MNRHFKLFTEHYLGSIRNPTIRVIDYFLVDQCGEMEKKGRKEGGRKGWRKKARSRERKRQRKSYKQVTSN